MPIPDNVTIATTVDTTDVIDSSVVRVRVGRNRQPNGTPDYWDDEPDFVWLFQDSGGVRYTPDDAEKIATMLMYEAKLARENNNRQKENN